MQIMGFMRMTTHSVYEYLTRFAFRSVVWNLQAGWGSSLQVIYM